LFIYIVPDPLLPLSNICKHGILKKCAVYNYLHEMQCFPLENPVAGIDETMKTTK
jgi:hypothetical protein